MSMTDSLKVLYTDYTNAYETNDSWEEFRDKLNDEEKRKVLYNDMAAAYNLKSQNFDEFNAYINKFFNPNDDNPMPGSNLNVADSDTKYQDSPDPITVDEIDIENDDSTALLESQVENNKSEQEFKDWYASAHQMYGLDPDPDHPDHHYDYKAAWRANVVPEMYENEKGEKEYHWPSQFKGDNHPNRWMQVDFEGERFITDTKNGTGFKVSEMESLLSKEYGLNKKEINEWKNVFGDNNMLEADEYLTKLIQSKMMPDYEGKPLLARSLHDVGNTFTSMVMGIGGMASYFVNVGGPGLAAQARTGVDLWEAGELPTMESWMEDWMKNNQPQTAGGEKVLMGLSLPYQMYTDNIVTPAAEWMDENTEGTLWANATEGGLNMLPFLAIAKGKYNRVQKLKTGVNPSMWSKMTKVHNIINKEFPKVTIEFSKLRNIARNMNKKEYNNFVSKMSENLGMKKSEFLKHMKNGGKKEVNFMSYIETFDRPWFQNLKSKVGIKSERQLGLRLSLKEKNKVKNNGIVVENEVLLPKGKDARQNVKQQYQNFNNQILLGENLKSNPSVPTKPSAIVPPVQQVPKLTPEKLATVGNQTTVPPSIAEQAKFRIQERQQKAELDAKTKQKSIIEEQIDLEEVATGEPSKLRDVSKSIDKDIKKLETPKPKVEAAKKPITKTEAAIASQSKKNKSIRIESKPKVESSPVPLKSEGWTKVKPKDNKNEPIHGRKFKDNEFFIQKKPTGSGGKMEIHQVDLNGKSLGVVGKNHTQAYNKIKSNIKSLEPKKKAYSEKLIDATKTKKAYSENPELNQIYKTINEVIDPKIKEIKANKNLTKEQKRRLVQIHENKRSQLKLDEKQVKKDVINKSLKQVEESKRVQRSFDVTTTRIKELKKEQIRYAKRFGSPSLDKKYELIRLNKDLKELNSIMKDLKKYKEQPMIMSSIIPGLPELITGIGNYIKRKSAKVLSSNEINYIRTTIDKAKKFRESKKPIPKDVKDTSKPIVPNKLKRNIFSEPENYAIEFERALKDVNSGRISAFLKAQNITEPLFNFIKDNKINPKRMRTLLDAIEDGVLVDKGNGKYELSQQKLMDYPSITPKEIQLIQSYRNLMDKGFNLAIKEGIISDDVFLKDYVSHLIIGRNKKNADFQAIAKKFHTKPSFTNKRYYQTLKELEAAGNIINTDMVYHIQQYYNSLYKAISDKRFIDYLSKTETADGLPLISHHKSFLDVKDKRKRYKNLQIKGLGKWYTKLNNQGKTILLENDMVYVHPEIYTGLKSYLKQGLATQFKTQTNFGKLWFGSKRAIKRIAMTNPAFHGINVISDVFVETKFSPSKTRKWLSAKGDGTASLLKLNDDNAILEFQAQCGLNLGYVSQVSENMRIQFKNNFPDLDNPPPKDISSWSERGKNILRKTIVSPVGKTVKYLDDVMWDKIVGQSQKHMHLAKTYEILQKQKYFDKKGNQLKTIPEKVLIDAGKTGADYVNNNLGTLPDIVFSESGGLMLDFITFAKNWTAGWMRQAITYPTVLTGGKLIRGGSINIGGRSFNPIPRFLQWKGQTKSEYNWTRNQILKHGIKAFLALIATNELISQIIQTFKEENKDSDWLTLNGNRYISFIQPGLNLSDRLKVDTGLEDVTRPGKNLYATNFLYKYMRDISLMFPYEPSSPTPFESGVKNVGKHLSHKIDPMVRNFEAIMSNRDYITKQPIRHPGATWTEQTKDMFKFLGHRLTPIGQAVAEDGYVFNQIRRWSWLTSVSASSVDPDNVQALDVMFKVMNRQDYKKTKLDDLVMEELFRGNLFGTVDKDGNQLTKGAFHIIQDNPEFYADAATILENLDKKHKNPLGFKFALLNKSEKLKYVHYIIDEWGLDEWEKLNKKYNLGVFVDELGE